MYGTISLFMGGTIGLGHTKCPGLFDICTNAEKLSNHDDLAAFNLLSYMVGVGS